MTFDQAEFDIRCEWGEHGVANLAPISDAIIIVDVLSFSTCVSIATSRGAIVYPYRWRDASRIEYARSLDAEVAGPRGESRYSLSPASLVDFPADARLVLPSPNGSTLTFAAGKTPTFAGCLRNAPAVARAALRCGPRIAVIPAGERWIEDDSLRPAVEDLLGAGAIIQHLPGLRSPEATLASDAFHGARQELLSRLRNCLSGQELIARGFERDVILAAELDADDAAPELIDNAYRRL